MPTKLDADKLLTAMPVLYHQVIADVGCGDGQIALPLAKYVHSGKIYALDTDQEKLDSLDEAVKRINLTNVVTMKLDGTGTLPLGDASVDGVILARVLHHVEDPKKLLAEASRILRRGGWLTVVELHKREEVEGHPMESRLAEEDTREMLREAGFRSPSRHQIDGRYYVLMPRK